MSQFDDVLKNIDELNNASVEWGTGFADVDFLKEQIFAYLKIAPQLAYTSPDIIKWARDVLGRAIIIHAYNNSPVYKDKIKKEWLKEKNCLELTAGAFLVEKKDLMAKSLWYGNIDTQQLQDNHQWFGNPEKQPILNSLWYNDVFESMDNRTSGTTSEPFEYRIWKEVYPIIEQHCHYNMILKEFDLGKDARTLYVSNPIGGVNYHKFIAGKTIVEVASGNDIGGEVARLLCGHGQESGEMHNIKFSNDAFLYMKDYCSFVIDYIKRNKINVICASGAFFELLNNFLLYDENSSFPKLVDLLSNTGDRVNIDTLEFMTDLGVSRHWCDHMRCWDGGASFFSCKNGVYHVQDELAYCFTAPDGRLASIDYFSYPSPFINYLNGDYCSIEEDYQKCLCGRWYRKFKFHNRKPRINRTAGNSYYNTEEVVKTLSEKYPLTQLSCQDGSILIQSNHLNEEQKKNITLDLAKEQLVAHFFESLNASGSGSSELYFSCVLASSYGLSYNYCCWYTKSGSASSCQVGSGINF